MKKVFQLILIVGLFALTSCGKDYVPTIVDPTLPVADGISVVATLSRPSSFFDGNTANYDIQINAGYNFGSSNLYIDHITRRQSNGFAPVRETYPLYLTIFPKPGGITIRNIKLGEIYQIVLQDVYGNWQVIFAQEWCDCQGRKADKPTVNKFITESNAHRKKAIKN